MIKHYLKNAIKSFSRNKFVTFINIFGISFTLFVMTLIFAFVDLEWGTDNPNEHKYDIVKLSQMEMFAYQYDTIYQIDSASINDTWVYDTLDYETIKGDGISNSASNLSYFTIKKYLSNLTEIKTKSFYRSNVSNIFLSSGKLSVSTNYTNQHYWDIYPYELKAGRFFNDSDVTNKESVAVITEKLAQEYFGNKNALNQTMLMYNQKWTVIGVVKNPREYQYDCFIPFTHVPDSELNSESPLGYFKLVFLTNGNQQIKRLKSELASIASTIEPYDKYTHFSFYPQTFSEKYATELMGVDASSSEEALQKMKFRLSLFSLFFILLPVLNLLNINLTRLVERKSEIGIRKAFGANSRHVFFQFLFENLLLSALAGITAIVLSYFAIRMLNQSEILDDTLVLNWAIIFYGIFGSLVFGILFGVLPAFRLSKLNIVNALKS